MFTVILR